MAQLIPFSQNYTDLTAKLGISRSKLERLSGLVIISYIRPDRFSETGQVFRI
jgi:hypothetical protein